MCKIRTTIKKDQNKTNTNIKTLEQLKNLTKQSIEDNNPSKLKQFSSKLISNPKR